MKRLNKREIESLKRNLSESQKFFLRKVVDNSKISAKIYLY